MIEIKLFGKITLINDQQVVDLESSLGKQLSQLFAFFLCHRKHIVTKDLLIDRIWPNSENPNSAIKYAIYRLRSEINKIEAINDYQWIETVSNGYQLNPEIEIELDTLKFESLLSKAKKQDDIDAYLNAFKMYDDDFLTGIDADWLYLDRSYFQSMYLQLAIYLANHFNVADKPYKAIEVCKKALIFDDLNEDLIYQYLLALINNKQYNVALNYYNDISKKYYSELGVELHVKTKSLFEIVSADVNLSNQNTSDFMTSYINQIQHKFGPMFCELNTFNAMLEFMKRDAERMKHPRYVLLFEIKTKDINNLKTTHKRLIKIIDISLRVNDVYTTFDDNRVAIVLDVHQKEDCYLVADRIVSRVYKVVSKDIVHVFYRLIAVKE